MLYLCLEYEPIGSYLDSKVSGFLFVSIIDYEVS